MVPSTQQCLDLMKKYEMLSNIRAHSVMVERIARLIGHGLEEAGAHISLNKITAGALMHDIGKTVCLNTGGDHEAVGREICLRNHLDEIADIVGEHVRLRNYNPHGTIKEKEVVYYADKRVNDDVIVTLEERLGYILSHYAKKKEDLRRRIRENFELCKVVEKKLFASLPFGPEDLAHMIK